MLLTILAALLLVDNIEPEDMDKLIREEQERKRQSEQAKQPQRPAPPVNPNLVLILFILLAAPIVVAIIYAIVTR